MTKKPIQSEIEQTLSGLDSLRALTLNFKHGGVQYNLDRPQTLKVVASGVYRYLWSKYQSTLNTEERERVKIMEQLLREKGIDPDNLPSK